MFLTSIVLTGLISVVLSAPNSPSNELSRRASHVIVPACKDVNNSTDTFSTWLYSNPTGLGLRQLSSYLYRDFLAYNNLLIMTLHGGSESILEGQKYVAEEEAILVTDLREAHVTKSKNMLEIIEDRGSLGWFGSDGKIVTSALRELRDANDEFSRTVIEKMPRNLQGLLKQWHNTTRMAIDAVIGLPALIG
jgi:hypothetical protein